MRLMLAIVLVALAGCSGNTFGDVPLEAEWLDEGAAQRLDPGFLGEPATSVRRLAGSDADRFLIGVFGPACPPPFEVRAERWGPEHTVYLQLDPPVDSCGETLTAWALELRWEDPVDPDSVSLGVDDRRASQTGPGIEILTPLVHTAYFVDPLAAGVEEVDAPWGEAVVLGESTPERLYVAVGSACRPDVSVDRGGVSELVLGFSDTASCDDSPGTFVLDIRWVEPVDPATATVRVRTP